MLLPFFEWCEATTIGQAIRESLWLFPVIESIHLLGLAMIGGALLVVDLRLLGFGLTHQPVAQLARSAHPWLVGSLAVMLTTGISLFLSESIRCYYSPPFWTKMELLLVADPVYVHRSAQSRASGRKNAWDLSGAGWWPSSPSPCGSALGSPGGGSRFID